jgi:hypothetical protein
MSETLNDKNQDDMSNGVLGTAWVRTSVYIFSFIGGFVAARAITPVAERVIPAEPDIYSTPTQHYVVV